MGNNQSEIHQHRQSNSFESGNTRFTSDNHGASMQNPFPIPVVHANSQDYTSSPGQSSRFDHTSSRPNIPTSALSPAAISNNNYDTHTTNQSIQENDNTSDDFRHLVELIGRYHALEQEKEKIDQRNQILLSEFDNARIEYEKVVQEIKSKNSAELESLKITLNAQFANEYEISIEKLKESFAKRISEITTITFPERILMSEEDALSKAIEDLEKYWIHKRQVVKDEYEAILSTKINISRREYQKVIRKFEDSRDQEFEDIKKAKKRRKSEGFFSGFFGFASESIEETETESEEEDVMTIEE